MTVPINEKARIVIADDDVENAKVVEESMKLEGHHTRVCSDGESALHLVKSWSPHLVLLDINMPKLTGLDCLKKIRAMKKEDYIGVILVTANSELDQIIEGLDAGADDYVIKPYRVDELRARVRATLRTKGLHDALRRTNKRLEDAATYDDLTGLRNMRFASKRIADEVELAKKQKTHISCVMLDMDHFKLINDKHDHLFGSFVLREIGQLLNSMLRPTDMAARYGGDEFFILMPGASTKDAVELSDHMRKTIESHKFRSGTHEARVTASFGVSGTQGLSDFSLVEARELIRSADAALYAAKNSGRNRVETMNMAKSS